MSPTLARFEMPIWDPCPFCELAAGRSETGHIIILRGIVPPSLLTDLRREAEKARDLAHKLNGPQTQRIQPLYLFTFHEKSEFLIE